MLAVHLSPAELQSPWRWEGWENCYRLGMDHQVSLLAAAAAAVLVPEHRRDHQGPWVACPSYASPAPPSLSEAEVADAELAFGRPLFGLSAASPACCPVPNWVRRQVPVLPRDQRVQLAYQAVAVRHPALHHHHHQEPAVRRGTDAAAWPGCTVDLPSCPVLPWH